MQDMEKICDLGRAVIQTELNAIHQLMNRIDHRFAQACQYLLDCEGRIIVIGMGKSGHIAKKIAATFASTGSPAFFVHSGEANHGDGPSIPVNYSLVSSGSQWKLYDMTVEGVSMLQSFRSQFADKLSRGNMTDLLNALKQHSQSH